VKEKHEKQLWYNNFKQHFMKTKSPQFSRHANGKTRYKINTCCKQHLKFQAIDLEQWFSNFLACGTPKETRKFSRHPNYVKKFEVDAKIH
jgi:hypothetical protein